ncbi:MAG: HIT family protein [Beijerinckiaceae bacterium]
MSAYDPNNIFARILRGELPCEKIHEDAHSFAFMDIMPRSDGHCLVIPKAPARTLFDIPFAVQPALFAAVQKVARAAKDGMGADGLTLQQFNEEAGGQMVFHVHFHIIPRWNGVKMKPHTGEMAPKEVIAAHAQKIRAALAAQ